MKQKPIVKLVRAVSLKVGDEYFTFRGSYHRRVLDVKAKKTRTKGLGVFLHTKWIGGDQPGYESSVCYGSNALVYKDVGWRETKYHAPDNAVNVSDELSGMISQFCKTGKYAGIHPNTPVSQAYAKPLHERLQKEINELKSLLQDSMGSCRQYLETINSLREECALKAKSIDELYASLTEKAQGNAALNNTISVLRHKLRTESGLRDDFGKDNVRLRGVVGDITQRLEDFRDGE